MVFVESVIPPNCRENFYRNAKDVRIELNFDEIEKTITPRRKEFPPIGSYNVVLNKIRLLPEGLAKVLDMSNRLKDNQKFFWQQVNETLLHEMFHMASSKNNRLRNIQYCGFDETKYKDEHTNRGLTEGMTDYLCEWGCKGMEAIDSPYYVEIQIVKKLFEIIGEQTMLEAYFTNQGVKPLEQKLLQLYSNEEEVSNLFKRIELSFQLTYVRGQQNILGNIQTSLINYYMRKIEYDYKNGNQTKEEIQDSVARYKEALVLPESLKLKKRNPKKYIGLRESVEKFEEVETLVDGLFHERTR